MPTEMLERIRAAAEWLRRSQAATGTGGSAGYYSPVRGWSAPYPETTGYIIPTLWSAADRLKEPAFAAAAEGMARWLLTIQDRAGWFPGGLWKAGGERKGSVFNTAQILFGLVEAARRTGDAAFWTAAARAAAWLVAGQNSEGRWVEGNYVAGYSPSYYAHVCWPMAVYWRESGNDALRACILRALDAVLSDRTPQGTFLRWGFRPGAAAYTHTIAYTLQGLIESARLLDAWQPYGLAGQESATLLASRYELSGRLAGAYGVNWEPRNWYICLTGHCQLASTWLRLFELTQTPTYLNVALKALEEVCRHQRRNARRPNTDGAIAGSAPFFGRYMFLRYPNWAAKFFIDALQFALMTTERLESSAPLQTAGAGGETP